MTKKEKKELNPIAEPHNNFGINKEEILKLVDGTEEHVQKLNLDSNETDSYFRSVLDNLMNDKNISLKTEYLTVNENFAGVKLEFLSRYGNMPYLKEFIKIFETKRVSLERKSRIEIIRALEKREEELRERNRGNFASMFGMG